jgi:KDO2-lipid IV(A) lauroyltransferase
MWMGHIIVAILKLSGLIPLRWAQRLGAGIGYLMSRFRNRSREVARLNLELVYPQLCDQERQQLWRETLRQTGMVSMEMGVLWGASPEKGLSLVRNAHNLEYLQQALAEQKGVLFCVPHLGNWEVLNHYITQQTDVVAMYRPAKDPVLDRWMLNSRQKTGIRLVPTTSAGVKELFRSIKRGEFVGILPDQEPRPRSGVFAPFMGMPALTPKLCHELLQRSDAVALFGFTRRLPKGEGFDIHFVKPDDDIYSEDAVTSATALNKAIEACVQHAPEQYQWTYKRFKRQPDNGKNPYRVAKIR